MLPLAVVLVGVLTIFKGLLIKLLETGIKSSFEKNLETIRNKLERSTKAYEILLEREMRFYEKLEPILAGSCSEIERSNLTICIKGAP